MQAKCGRRAPPARGDAIRSRPKTLPARGWSRRRGGRAMRHPGPGRRSRQPPRPLEPEEFAPRRRWRQVVLGSTHRRHGPQDAQPGPQHTPARARRGLGSAAVGDLLAHQQDVVQGAVELTVAAAVEAAPYDFVHWRLGWADAGVGSGSVGQPIVARARGAMSTLTGVPASSSSNSPSSCSGMGLTGVNP